jgi:hypothetical protein
MTYYFDPHLIDGFRETLGRCSRAGRHVGAAPRGSTVERRRPSPARHTPHRRGEADPDGCSDHARAPCGCGHHAARRSDRRRLVRPGNVGESGARPFTASAFFQCARAQTCSASRPVPAARGTVTYHLRLQRRDGTSADPPTYRSTVLRRQQGDTIPLSRDRTLSPPRGAGLHDDARGATVAAQRAPRCPPGRRQARAERRRARPGRTT